MKKSLFSQISSILLFNIILFSIYSFSLNEGKDNPPALPTFFSKTIQQFNSQVKQTIKKKILSADLPQKNYFVQDKVNQLKSIKPNFELPTLMMTGSCPDIDVIDLRNVAGFPQMDDLTVCGAADTLSFMLFTGDPGEIKGFELRLNLPEGIEYAGWEFTQLGNTSISVTKPKLNKPEFFIDGITGDSLVIANIGIRANCEVDKTEMLFFDFNYEYTFIDTNGVAHSCEGTYTPNLEYNSAIHEPVLNMLSPLTPTTARITALGEPTCQTILISQDGLSAYVDSFTFEIIGIDLDGDIILDSVTANGIEIPIGSIPYDASSMTAAFKLDENYFPDNGLENGPDERMNTNEIMTIEVCYAINSCPSATDIPFLYNAFFGCDGEICQSSSQNTFIEIRPTGSLDPIGTSMLNMDGIEICGNPGMVSVTLENPNTDTEQNIYEDIKIGFQTCNKPNLEVTGVTVGGVVIPDSLYTWVADDINIDFSRNTLTTLGLEDYDMDGFYDDLRGGNSISAVVEISVTCAIDTTGGDCANINCKDVQFYTEVKTNCGNTYKGFPTPDKFNLVYGATSVSNPTEAEFGTTGVLGYDFGVYSDNTDTVATDSSALEVIFCYTFETENIQDCPSGATNYLLVDFAGDPKFAKDIEFLEGTDSLSIDGGLTYTLIGNTTFTRPDDNSFSMTINGGSNAMDVCYKYSIEMDTCLCSPVGYFTAKQQVISTCSDCVDDCEILKACRDVTFKADPTCKDCDCIVQHGIERSERLNLGYKDKTMTERHTRQSLVDAGRAIDLTRFVPGDTLIHEDYFIPIDQAAFDNLIRWNIVWTFYDNNSTANSEIDNLELNIDAHNSELFKMQFSKVNGSRVDVDLTALEGCLTDNITQYGGVWSYVNKTPWGDAIDYVDTHNSSADYLDNNRINISFWNYDKIEACGGTYNTHTGGDCLDELIAGYNIEIGDTIHFGWRAPLIKNPHRAALEAVGMAPPATNIARIYPAFNVYMEDLVGGNATSCYTLAGGACETFQPLYLDCPGELDVVTRMDLTDCGGTVTHEFTVNDLAGPVGDPWFTEEYRPLIKIRDVDALIRAPLAYCANAQVEKLGVTYDVFVDSTINMICNPATGFDEEICAVESGNSGKVVFDLTAQGIPALGIGLDNCDTIRLSYDLCMICPGDIEDVSAYTLVYDWSYTGVPLVKDSDEHNQYKCNIGTNLENTACDDHGLVDGNDLWQELNLDTMMNIVDRESSVFILTDDRNPLDPVSITNQSGNLLTSDNPGVSEEIKQIQICNTDADSTATGVGATVTIPSSVKFTNAYSDTSGTPVPYTYSLVSDDGENKIYNIILGVNTLDPNTCDTFYVGTTLLFCPEAGSAPPKICVGVYSGCASDIVKAALSASGGCGGTEICYTYIFGEVGIQAEWFDMPSAPKLCDTLTFNVRVKNVKQLQVLDLEPVFDLPPGVTPIDGTWEVSYPGGVVAPLNWVSIGSNPDIVSGNTYAYSDDALWNTKIDMDGLQGVSAANATLDSNKVAFRFKVLTTCDEFLSGSKLLTETTANDPCSDSRTKTGTVESPGVIIEGAAPIDYAQLLLVSNPEIINCEGTDNTFGITAINTGDKSTSDSVLFCLTIPAELTYTDGSIMFVSPAGFTPENVIKTTIGTKEEICFNAPTIGAYGTMSINFDAVMDKNAECGDIRIGTDVKSFVDMITCDPGPPAACGVFVQNSINSSVNVELAPPFIAENIGIYTDCASSSDSIKLYFEYDINHDGPDAINQVYTVNFYEDIDGSQTVNANIDALLGTTSSTFDVNDGASIKITGEVTVVADKSCPVLFEVIYDTDCTCDRTENYLTDITLKTLKDYQEPITMCPGSCFDIEVCDFVEVTADSVLGATGIIYTPSLNWVPANCYTLPHDSSGTTVTKGPPSSPVHLNYTNLTNNSAGTSGVEEGLLFAEQSNQSASCGNTPGEDYGEAWLIVSYSFPVNVDSIFTGTGRVSGWSGNLDSYKGHDLKLEYSDDAINWTNIGSAFENPADISNVGGYELPTPITAQYWRLSSNNNPGNWGTSEFRLQGPNIPFQSTPPVSRAGNTVTICIPESVGIEAPWEVEFSTGTGNCTVKEKLEIWQSGTPPIEIEGDTLVCGDECITLELIIPNDATAGMTVAWTPASLIDDPSDFRVKACGLTGDVTFEATVTYAEGNCQEILQFPVKHYPSNPINVIADTIYCYNPLLPPTLTADTGWDTYTWYDVSTGTEVIVFTSFSNIFIPTSGGDYIVKATRVGTLCPAVSSATPVATDICPLDLGDLPDPNNGTAADDYETLLSNNGPSHVLVDDLYLGTTVDAETDGQPDNDAFGDGVDEDGIVIHPTLNIFPGNTIRLPLAITNGTGSTAYLEAWIDWNGDGKFDGPNEVVANIDDGSTSFPSFLSITVPANAIVGSLLGVRLRLSNTDGLTPYGPANSGEIEDFLIGVGCEQVICLPATIEINKEE